MHLSPPESRYEEIYRTGEHLARAVAHLNALDPRPDVVLATGDLVERGEAGEYERLYQQLEPLRMPVYLVPGNHRRPSDASACARSPSILAARRRVHPVHRRGLAGAAGGPRHADPGGERWAALRREARLARRAPCRGAGAADRGVHASPAVRHRHEEDGRDGARRHRWTRRGDPPAPAGRADRVWTPAPVDRAALRRQSPCLPAPPPHTSSPSTWGPCRASPR